ncbi:AAA family ATPase [bacterium]|nr:AAA family ATPase [bacterium]
MNDTPTLTPCQEKALELLRSPDNIFLTGCAGSGKSYLIREYLKEMPSKVFPTLASTGAAAVLVGGRTFHSFFGLGIMEGGLEATIKRAVENKQVKKRLREINGFILDEVSMIPSAALEAAEHIARKVRMKSMAWGGIRVIAVGDFCQLAPVNRFGSTPDWAFLSEVWERTDFKPAVLNTMVRTKDKKFLEVLNYLRCGVVNDTVAHFLDNHIPDDYIESTKTHLFGRRDQTDNYNLKRLNEVDGKLHTFETVYKGESRFFDNLKQNAPVAEKLLLKVGALVMMRINDPEQRFVNGSTGEVIEIFQERLIIRLKRGRTIEVEPFAFSMLNAEGEEVASATNFPVNLAYATTIHKSQGATLDEVAVDLKNLWEAGQAYVALSRLRESRGLTLLGWHPKSIKADPHVLDFHEKIGFVN